jgi:hypothetical protein
MGRISIAVLAPSEGGRDPTATSETGPGQPEQCRRLSFPEAIQTGIAEVKAHQQPKGWFSNKAAAESDQTVHDGIVSQSGPSSP